MISSSNPRLERGLDAMLLVYSLLESHPASAICEQFLRTHTGWFTTTLTLLEVKAILTKVYGVDGHLATQKLVQVTMGPLAILSVKGATVVAAMGTADELGIDLTDAVLLQTVHEQGVTRLATDDGKLTQVCRQSGIIPENPIDTALRQQMAAWEAAHLPAKGLPRLLYQIYQWLSQNYPHAAQEFWSRTGGGSHVP
jgi:predicted nucleic acid-binding protein